MVRSVRITGAGISALMAAATAVSIGLAPIATAKGQEGGRTCTGPELAHGCTPVALQQTPLAGMPLGCKPTGHVTMACGRRGFHEALAAQQDSAAHSSAVR